MTEWWNERDAISKIDAEFRRQAGIATPLELERLTPAYQRDRAAAVQRLEREASLELRVQFNRMVTASQKATDARRRESERWDAGRLNAEMQLADIEILKALTKVGPSGLAAVLAKAEATGDIHVKRAVAAKISSIQGRWEPGSPERMDLQGLTRRAQSVLDQLQVTPEIVAADAALTDASLQVSEASRMVRGSLDTLDLPAAEVRGLLDRVQIHHAAEAGGWRTTVSVDWPAEK